MALTFTPVSRKVRGDRTVAVVDVLWDASYPLGGEAVTAADFGLSNIDQIQPSVAHDPDTVDNGFLVVFDPAASKLVAFFGDNNNASDGPFIEISTFDAAAYTSRLVVEG